MRSFALGSLLWSGMATLAVGQSGTVDPTTVEGCTQFIEYPDPSSPAGDSCASIAAYWEITEEAFMIWNPSVGSDCSNLVPGNSYCIEENYSNIPSHLPVTSSKPTSKKPTATSTKPSASASKTDSSIPAPTQNGLTPDCRQYYLVESGDFCVAIVDRFGTFSLSQFYSWNPAVGSSCGGLQAGYYVCVGVAGTPSTRTFTTSTTPASKPTAAPVPQGPQPQQPNIVKGCKKYYKVQSGDNCDAIVNRYGTFTFAQFYSWNPDVGSACQGLWLGYNVCVGVAGTPSTPTQKPTAPTGVVTPSPIQPGVISTCKKFVKSSPSGASCQKFSEGNRISLAQLYAWNPVLGRHGENCGSQFKNSMNYCVAVSAPLPAPGPVQPGVPDTCIRYGDALPGGVCPKFANRFGISQSQLFSWNPALGRNGENCQTKFWAGYWYCVQVAGGQ